MDFHRWKISTYEVPDFPSHLDIHLSPIENCPTTDVSSMMTCYDINLEEGKPVIEIFHPHFQHNT